MYFDGASNQKGFGVSILLVVLKSVRIPILVKLDFEVANNMMQYKAYIIGLQPATEIGFKKFLIYEDSNLIINHICQKYRVRGESLSPYQAYFIDLTKHSMHITYTYLLREDNQFVDALAKLASIINIPRHDHLIMITIEQKGKLVHGFNITLVTWYYHTYQYLTWKEYPPRPSRKPSEH